MENNNNHECTQKDEIAKIKKILYGNGEKGVCENIRDIQTDISTIKKYIEKTENRFWAIVTKLAPYLLGGLLAYNQFFGNGGNPPIPPVQ